MSSALDLRRPSPVAPFARSPKRVASHRSEKWDFDWTWRYVTCGETLPKSIALAYDPPHLGLDGYGTPEYLELLDMLVTSDRFLAVRSDSCLGTIKGKPSE